MKTFLTYSTLLAIVGFPSVALAESTGVLLPAYLNTTTIITFFCAACLGLLTVSDYARTHRLPIRSLAKASTDAGRHERHRLAA